MDISFDGTDYKLLQIHANGYVGILPNEWEDTIHVLNDAELFPSGPGRNLTIREVDERDLVESLCTTLSTCISTIQEGTVSLKDILTPFFNAVGVAAQVNGQKALDFLKKPFFSQVAAGKSAVISSADSS